MKELIKKVEQWADEKGILAAGDLLTQALKGQEEAQEFYEAVNDMMDDPADAYLSESAKMELGDRVVTCIVAAKIGGWDLQECAKMAYEKINQRGGKMINGAFVKDSDLKEVEDSPEPKKDYLTAARESKEKAIRSINAILRAFEAETGLEVTQVSNDVQITISGAFKREFDMVVEL